MTDFDTMPAPPQTLTLETDRDTLVDHDALNAGMRDANKAVLFAALAAAGIMQVIVTFDGYGDSGQIDSVEAKAHSVLRRIERVWFWARRPDQAEAVAAEARALGLPAAAAPDLEAAAGAADIVSCCTLAGAPLVYGKWLRPGTHLDLIGAFKPEMRESDDAAIKQASLFADTREGVLGEARDVLQPLRAGVIGPEHVRGDLFDLCREEAGVRSQAAGDFNVFKSVGAALEDLAAARVAYETVAAEP